MFWRQAACKRTATLLANNSQHCWMLHDDVASVCTPCCMLLCVVAKSLKPVNLFSQKLPTFLLFRDRQSVAQQCWIRLHSSSNIVGATHAHDLWFTKTYGVVSFPGCTAGLNIVGSCCIRLHAALLSLPLAGGPREVKCFNASWRLISPASFHTSSDNRERNTQKWNSNNKVYVRRKTLIHGCCWEILWNKLRETFCNDVLVKFSTNLPTAVKIKQTGTTCLSK